MFSKIESLQQVQDVVQLIVRLVVSDVGLILGTCTCTWFEYLLPCVPTCTCYRRLVF